MSHDQAECVAGPEVDLLAQMHVIFWDFDGVIKDSVAVKSVGFEQLFLPYGQPVASRVRQHHEANGGVSRFEKIPVYLGWVGLPVTADNVQKFCDQFSALVLQAVIDAAWVPGVREYLLARHGSQYFVLVTATPQKEIEAILHTLGIAHCFRQIYGAPTSKTTAIGDVLAHLKCQPAHALMIGDSDTDFDAAQANRVSFLLRRTPLNLALQKRHVGQMFEGLNNE